MPPGQCPPPPADRILLGLIAVTTVGVGAAAAVAAGSLVTVTTLMPAINVGALFIWAGGLGEQRQQWQHDGRQQQCQCGSRGVRVQFLGSHAQPTLGDAFWQEEDNGEDEGDE